MINPEQKRDYGKKRNNKIVVRLNHEELKEINRIAAQHGFADISPFIRWFFLGRGTQKFLNEEKIQNKMIEILEKETH